MTKTEQKYLQLCTQEDSTNIYSRVHIKDQAETQQLDTSGHWRLRKHNGARPELVHGHPVVSTATWTEAYS